MPCLFSAWKKGIESLSRRGCWLILPRPHLLLLLLFRHPNQENSELHLQTAKKLRNVSHRAPVPIGASLSPSSSMRETDSHLFFSIYLQLISSHREILINEVLERNWVPRLLDWLKLYHLPEVQVGRSVERKEEGHIYYLFLLSFCSHSTHAHICL